MYVSGNLFLSGNLQVTGSGGGGGGSGGGGDTFSDTTTSTTGSEVVTIDTYTTLAASQSISMKTTIWAVATGSNDHAKYVVESLFSRTGSNAEEKDTNFISVFEDVVGWNVSFSTSGADILTHVTGATSSSIAWRCFQESSEHG